MDRLSDFRSVFAEVVVARAACRDPRIKAAFARVPRHEFVDAGPWRFAEDGPLTGSADPALLYQDVALALSFERGIPTGLPSLHARCLDACAPKEGEAAIQVGAGAGYFTAILAELVGPNGSVRAFEIDVALAAKAERNISAWSNVVVEACSGMVAKGPVDLIYVCAGVQQIPRSWLQALNAGGRLVLPLTPGEAEGGVLLVTSIANERYAARFITPARFLPCIGGSDSEAAKLLRSAFTMGNSTSVRSLRLAHEAPDSTAWFVGDGWWLSYRKPDA